MKGRGSAMAALTIILTTMWLLPVVQPRSAEAAVATFSGDGDGSTGFFFLNMGPVTVTYTHGGTSNFIVHDEHTSGQETLFLANDFGDV